jgi:hypothetical protein
MRRLAVPDESSTSFKSGLGKILRVIAEVLLCRQRKQCFDKITTNLYYSTMLKRGYGSLAKLASIACAACLGLLLFFTAVSTEATPTISWQPAEVTATISAGSSNTIPVTFTASANLTGVSIRVLPALEPFVKVEPASFSAITKGQALGLNLIVRPAASVLPGTVEGTIQVRSSSEPGKNIARPLPVSLTVTWATFSNATAGVQFSYPDFGLASKVETSATDSGGTELDIQFQSPNDTNFVTGFNIFLRPNSNHVSLSDWFAQSIDTYGVLVPSGAFVQKQFGNGILALVLSGPIPQTYNDGPVMTGYAISPSGDTIIVIGQSQDNDFWLHGLTSQQVTQMLEQVLASLQVP